MAVTSRHGDTGHEPAARFRHEALLYAGEDEFVAGCSAFVRDGVRAGEPTLVVVAAPKLERLREALGDDAEAVQFADMTDVGANPAWIIPAWQEFVERCGAAGRRLRGIGEPIVPERDADELVECERHEALLNLAFADVDDFWLLCPYDVEALPAEVVEEARRTHPFLTDGDGGRQSGVYSGLDAIAAPFAEPLADAPAEAVELRVEPGGLDSARRFVAEEAGRLGLGRNRSLELVVAATQVAANCVEDGGGALLRIWRGPARLVCEISGSGRLAHPLADRELPRPGDPVGHGLWLANRLCELVQVRSFPEELVVRLHVALG